MILNKGESMTDEILIQEVITRYEKMEDHLKSRLTDYIDSLEDYSHINKILYNLNREGA